ncbi:MAG: hypothetical protein QNK03_11545 [Myxococcota bacterium]|nr:hypothetical protein [Myxococcota bacterium]
MGLLGGGRTAVGFLRPSPSGALPGGVLLLGALLLGAALLGAALLGGLALPAAAATGEGACRAWPGEPDPLPDVSSADPFAARWAALRTAELTRLARLLEPIDGVEAHRTWLHVACLDPGSATARSGVARTRPRAIHRVDPLGPESDPTFDARASLDAALAVAARAAAGAADAAVRVAAEPARPPRTTVQAAARPRPDPIPVSIGSDARVAEPVTTSPPLVAVASEPAPAPIPAPRVVDWSAIDAEIEQADELLFEARFRQALDLIARARDRVEGRNGDSGAAPRRARVEVLAATAEVALGDTEAAHRSFRRALAADPGLDLDPRATPPKVLRAFEAARSEARAPGGPG